MKQIKPYNQVKIGDMAMESPDAGNNWDNELGEIVWKGTAFELEKSQYKYLADDDEWTDDDLYEYDLVVVITTGWDGGPTLFSYDEDPCPCSCVVFED